jgi:hypothetical protein
MGGGLTVDVTDAEQGTANLINADQLGGLGANQYLLANEYKSEVIENLSMHNWINTEDVYTQSIMVNGVTANNSVIVSASTDSIEDYCKCGVRCVTQTEGHLTFMANKEPKADLSVNVLILN